MMVEKPPTRAIESSATAPGRSHGCGASCDKTAASMRSAGSACRESSSIPSCDSKHRGQSCIWNVQSLYSVHKRCVHADRLSNVEVVWRSLEHLLVNRLILLSSAVSCQTH